MKKVFTILLGFIISLTVMGQEVHSKQQRLEKYSRVSEFDAQNRTNIDERQGFFKVENPQSDILKSSQATKQRLDSMLYYLGNGSSQWSIAKKREFIYDVSGNLTSETHFNLVGSTPQWEGQYKFEYTYNTISNLILQLHYDWDYSTNQWIYFRKAELTYDAFNNLTLQQGYDWDEGVNQWIFVYKVESTYDESGEMTQKIVYNWDESTSNWIDNLKFEYSYNTNGNLTLEFHYLWDESSSQWNAWHKIEYTYDTNGNLTLELYYLWDGSSQWYISSKIEFIYEVSGNLTLELHYDWDESTSQWVNEIKYEYTYNNSYTYDKLILPYYELEMYNKHMKTDYIKYGWFNSSNTWGEWDKWELFYSEQNVPGILDVSLSDINIYPNPAQEFVVFDLDNISNSTIVEIYDFQGKKVLEQDIYNNNQVTVNQLTSGLYFYRFTHSDKTYSGKLIIK